MNAVLLRHRPVSKHPESTGRRATLVFLLINGGWIQGDPPRLECRLVLARSKLAAAEQPDRIEKHARLELRLANLSTLVAVGNDTAPGVVVEGGSRNLSGSNRYRKMSGPPFLADVSDGPAIHAAWIGFEGLDDLEGSNFLECRSTLPGGNVASKDVFEAAVTR